jgi:hypothetical protein
VKSILPLLLLALPVAACSSAPLESTAHTSEEVDSATTTYLLPTEDDVRIACRSTWTNAWCDLADAQSAADACVSTLVSSGARPACANSAAGCFEHVTASTPCAANGPIYPTQASCDAPVERTCAFYSACLEAAAPCGASGYALGYGEKYCSRYDVDDGFSPEGIVWRNAVLHCLQEALVPELPHASTMTCNAITTFAFDSHPRCYTEGPSICFLPPSDLANVIGVIDGKDLLSLRSAKQIATVAATCVGQLFDALADVDAPETRQQIPPAALDRSVLNDRLQFWQDVAARGDAP